MYPSPHQEAGNNAPIASSYIDASSYSNQETEENSSSAYDENPSSPYAEPEQEEEMADYQPPTRERRGLLMDLIAYPGRSVRSYCLPGMHTFAAETLNARWDVLWISLFALPVLSSLLALVLGANGPHIAPTMLWGIVLGPFIVIPALFFMVQGMIWPLARHYQGGGSFLEQCYTTFLPLAPVFFLGSVVSLLIATNSTSRIGAILILIEFVLFFYGSVLLVMSLKATHGLTTWEAFTLAILPFFSILAVIIIVLVVAFIVAANSNGDSNGNNSGGSNNSSDNSNNTSGGNTNNLNNNTSGGNTDNLNNNTNNNQGVYYYRDNYWWWGGSRSSSSSTNQGPRQKIQWFCPTCQYRRWIKQGPEEVACVRCGEPMQMTESIR